MSLLYPQARKLTSIEYLNSSQECDLVEYMAYLDLGEIPQHKKTFKEVDVLNKIFMQFGTASDELDPSKTLFLKNKYLYLYGEGAMYYLQARQSMNAEKRELDTLECSVLTQFLENQFQFDTDLCLISLGSANAEKEINCLFSFKKKHRRFPCNIYFTPIDVSTSLIQIATLYFNNKLASETNIHIEPIIGEFKDIAERPTVFSFYNRKSVRIFTLFGSTIGNYKESFLLDQLMQIMREGDFLFIGYDIKKSSEKEDEIKNRIFRQYNTIGNIQFMLNPLSYLPKYRGYIGFDKYFQLDIEKSVITADSDSYDTLTDVPDSYCYAPLLTIPDISGISPTPSNLMDHKLKISLAQSTKYDYGSFITWISAYRFHTSTETWRFAIEPGGLKQTSACTIVKKVLDETTLETVQKVEKGS